MENVLANPAAWVRFRTDVIAPSAVMHPQYAVRQMEVVFSDGERIYCPLIRRNMRGFRWRLDRHLCMMPETVEVY